MFGIDRGILSQVVDLDDYGLYNEGDELIEDFMDFFEDDEKKDLTN